MKNNLALVAALMLAGMSSSAAENLMYNSSFELGSKGYGCFHGVTVESGAIDFPDNGMAVDVGVHQFGGQSLRLTCTVPYTTTLAGSELKLVPEKKYTFSFWAKSDVANRSVNLIFSSRTPEGKTVKTNRKETSFPLGKEWSRYSFAVTPQAEYYLFNLTCSVPGSFWLDGLQMEEGELTEYHPASEIETAVYLPKTVSGTDEIKGEVCAIAYGQTQARQRVKLAVFDSFLEQQTAEQVLEFDLPAGKMVKRDFTFTGTRFGGLTVLPTPGVAASAAFLVHLHALPDSRHGGFQLGCNGNFIGRGISLPGNRGARTLNTYGGPDTLARDRVMIGGLFRVWGNDLTWRYLEPEQGKFVWNRSDRMVAEAGKQGLKLEFTLTGNFCNNEYPGQQYLPDWVIQRDRSGKPEKSLLLKNESSRHMTYLPPLEDWRDYVRAVASRYKGKIAYYDPINESNVGFPPETYLEYLRVAYEEIKKADPAAQVVALSTTEDIGGRAAKFMEDVLRLGGGNFLDAISFHPYGSRMDDTKGVTAMQRIRQLRQIMQAAGVDKPLWNDETLYLNSTPQGHYELENQVPTGAIARRLMMDMGEGLAANTSLSFEQYFKDPQNPHHLRANWEQVLQPSEIYAEQNAAASFLTGAAPVKTLELRGDVLGYLFKNRDRLCAAIWSRTQQKKSVTIKAAGGAKISAFDLLGNKTQSGPEVVLELGRQPHYLEWTGGNAEVAAKSLEEAQIR